MDRADIGREAEKESQAMRRRVKDRFMGLELPWDSIGPLDNLSLQRLRNVKHGAHLCDGVELPVSRLSHVKTEDVPGGGAASSAMPEIRPPPGLER